MSNLKMPKGANKIENRSKDQLIIMREAIENNKQDMKSEMKDSIHHGSG